MNLDHVRRQMIVKSALMLFLLVSFATLVRPFVVSQPMALTYLGIFDALLCGVLFLYLSQNRVQPWHAYLVIAASFIAILPVMYLTGGVYSHFAVVLPLAPVMVCLIASARVAWIVAIGCIAILGAFYAVVPVLSEQEGLWQMPGDARVRLLWLSLGCILGAVFGAEFDKVSSHLSHASCSPSLIDKATGALQKHSILDALSVKRGKVVAQEKWLSVVLLQINGLSRIRALYGDAAVSKVLGSIGALLKDSTREEEDAVGRFDDDTFMLVLEHVDQCHAHRIAEKIKEVCGSQPVYFDNDRIKFSVALGYCSLPGQEAHSDDMLLKSAKRALYTAKRSGNSSVVGAEESAVQGMG